MAVELLESLSRSIVEFETGPLLGPINDAIGAFDKHFPEPWRSFLFGPQFVDTRMLEYPLMRPFIPMAVVAFYVISVLLGLALAPKGKSAEPKRDRPLLTVLTSAHNAAMCLLSAWMSYEAFMSAAESFGWFTPGVPKAPWCHPVDPAGSPYSPAAARMARVTWVFCMSKYPELIDTLIMFIKGNYRQVSFLHVMHHAVMIYPVGLINAPYYPTADGYFPVLLNSSVHVIMYGHYFATGLGLPSPFKMYISSIQMTQFVAIIIQAVIILSPACGVTPRLPWMVTLFFMGLFFSLFAQYRVVEMARLAKLKREAAAAPKGAASDAVAADSKKAK